MSAVMDKILKELKGIEDESLLKEIYILLRGLKDTHESMPLNAEQTRRVEEARADYAANRYHTTDELFNELLNE